MSEAFVNVSADAGSNWALCTLCNDDPNVYQASVVPSEEPNVFLKFDNGLVQFEGDRILHTAGSNPDSNQ